MRDMKARRERDRRYLHKLRSIRKARRECVDCCAIAKIGHVLCSDCLGDRRARITAKRQRTAA